MKAKQWPPWPVIGHDWAVEFLQRALAHGRSRHAYLFIGPAGLGKRQLALAFVMAQNCEAGDAARPCQQCRSCQLIASERSPDIIFTRTSGNNETILIEEIRRVSTFFALHPYEMRHRIAILDNFERAAPNAQDALLKTLEEPPSYASLILLAREESSILPTILSRCQQLRLRPSPPANWPSSSSLTVVRRQNAPAYSRKSAAAGQVGRSARCGIQPCSRQGTTPWIRWRLA